MRGAQLQVTEEGSGQIQREEETAAMATPSLTPQQCLHPQATLPPDFWGESSLPHLTENGFLSLPSGHSLPVPGHRGVVQGGDKAGGHSVDPTDMFHIRVRPPLLPGRLHWSLLQATAPQPQGRCEGRTPAAPRQVHRCTHRFVTPAPLPPSPCSPASEHFSTGPGKSLTHGR
uniref:Uncharacterized protein n=1 Tax=Molossus molossus TaxID=27622 RepID=A0A7J8DU61_MOLMO|nr:hypothetical protein HJG59_009205 [Molossus molossus]